MNILYTIKITVHVIGNDIVFCWLSIGECPSNSPFLKNNGAEAHCF